MKPSGTDRPAGRGKRGGLPVGPFEAVGDEGGEGWRRACVAHLGQGRVGRRKNVEAAFGGGQVVAAIRAIAVVGVAGGLGFIAAGGLIAMNVMPEMLRRLAGFVLAIDRRAGPDELERQYHKHQASQDFTHKAEY